MVVLSRFGGQGGSTAARVSPDRYTAGAQSRRRVLGWCAVRSPPECPWVLYFDERKFSQEVYRNDHVSGSLFGVSETSTIWCLFGACLANLAVVESVY